MLGPDRAKVFDYHFGVEPTGNAPEDPQGEFKNKNILIQRHTLAETAKKFEFTEDKAQQILAESRRLLFEARAKRPRPHLDDKIVTAWERADDLSLRARLRGAGRPSLSRGSDEGCRFCRGKTIARRQRR